MCFPSWLGLVEVSQREMWIATCGGGLSILVLVVICFTCARLIMNSLAASACAVGLSIGVMMQFKCIHPPGGAKDLAAVRSLDSFVDIDEEDLMYLVEKLSGQRPKL